MALEGMAATLLDKSQQDPDSGIDMAALDDLWDLKGRLVDFSLVQVQHGSCSAAPALLLHVLYVRPCISICNGSVVKLLKHYPHTDCTAITKVR